MCSHFTPEEIARIRVSENSTTPFNLANIRDRIAEYSVVATKVHNMTQSTRAPHPPHKPQPRKAEPHWEALGEATGMDPHEARIIIEGVLNKPNDMTLPLLRQLMMVGKLTVGSELSEHRAREAERHRTFAAQVESYNKRLQNLEVPLAKLRELKAERDAIYAETWVNIVDELFSHCVVADHKFRRLHPNIAAAMLVLDRNSKYVVIDRMERDDWFIEVQWPFIYKFKSPHIDTVLGFFDKVGIFGLGKPPKGNAPQGVDDRAEGTAEAVEQPEPPEASAELPDADTVGA